MAWLAFDRAIALSSHFGLAGPLQRWEKVRTRIRPPTPPFRLAPIKLMRP